MFAGTFLPTWALHAGHQAEGNPLNTHHCGGALERAFPELKTLNVQFQVGRGLLSVDQKPMHVMILVGNFFVFLEDSHGYLEPVPRVRIVEVEVLGYFHGALQVALVIPDGELRLRDALGAPEQEEIVLQDAFTAIFSSSFRSSR